eukprot:CAMPEP_0113499488 /NCGR_PEP_ID=MMETSP0014_2-20120614/31777_1 /TAXON_ID=2857 /ORGANISM="Nitzschia sp." /LENGTH=359 /DNA_ID=CAMNT_0000393671 /DNA_START=776 /DNA_END=1852 /DNA_ORIENTATION=- /assembly_acc=CAM_ASM_000159
MAKSNAFQYGANLGMKLGFLPNKSSSSSSSLLKNNNKKPGQSDDSPPEEDTGTTTRTRNNNTNGGSQQFVANDVDVDVGIDSTTSGWFYDYDWIIRINPDVLIRNSTFLQDHMTNSVSSSSLAKSSSLTTTPRRDKDSVVVDAILVDCRRDVKSRTTQRIHTDFLAIRPNVIADKYQQKIQQQLLQQNQMQQQQQQKKKSGAKTATQAVVPSSPNSNTPFSVMSTETWNRRLLNHEATFFDVIQPLMMIGKRMATSQEEESTTIRWLPNVQPSNGMCRVMGPQSPVVHSHTNFRTNTTAATTTNHSHSSQQPKANTDTDTDRTDVSSTTGLINAAAPPPGGEDNAKANASDSHNHNVKK